jgi:hypothetical protein
MPADSACRARFTAQDKRLGVSSILPPGVLFHGAEPAFLLDILAVYFGL